jgi:multiple sugar transport system permease protein
MSADADMFSSTAPPTAVEGAERVVSPRRRRGTRRVGAVVLNLLLYVIAFMCMFPFLWMLATALKPEDNAITDNLFFGYSLTWSNFKQAWDFFPFGQFMVNSFIYSFGVTAVVLVASTTGGYAFARLKFWGREKLFSVYVATLLVPAAVTVIPLFLLATKLHIYNTYLGLIFPVSFGAFGTFFMRQFFRTLPEELRDSARMDGASEFWIFSRIMVPLVRAGVAVLAVFTFVAFWGDFLWPLIVTQSPSLYTLNLGLSEFQGEYGGYWSYMMAGCVLTVLPAIILVIILQKYLVKGLAFSGFGGR